MTTPSRNIHRSINAPFSWVRTSHAGLPVSSGSGTTVLGVESDVRPASVSSPKRANKTRANRPWNHEWSRLYGGTGRVVYSIGTAGNEDTVVNTGYLPSTSFLEQPDTSKVQGLMSNCRLKALAKGTSQAAQANAALYQARDIVRMGGEYTHRAASGLDNLMGPGGLFKKFGRMSSWKKIPSDYLAYLYGIAPLGDDIASALDTMNRYKDLGLGMAMILKASTNLRSEREVYGSLHVGGPTGDFAVKYRGSTHTGCRCGYLYNLPAWFMDECPTVAPFSTAFELARFSFVLDWFLPVGNWIGALESAQFSPYFVEGWEVWKAEETVDLSSAEKQSKLERTPSIQLAGKFVRGAMQRSVVSSAPGTALTRPALNPFPGIDKVAQGLSLLTQVLQRWR